MAYEKLTESLEYILDWFTFPKLMTECVELPERHKEAIREAIRVIDEKETSYAYPDNLIAELVPGFFRKQPSEDQITGLSEALGRLSDAERTVLEYRYQEKLDIPEIARKTGKPEDYVRLAIKGAISKLKAPRNSDLIRYGIEGSRIKAENDEYLKSQEDFEKAKAKLLKSAEEVNSALDEYMLSVIQIRNYLDAKGDAQ